MTVSFHPVASTETLEARAWYEARSPVSALAFAREVERAVRLIAEAPGRYAVAEAGTRRLPLRQFPFNVFYRETGSAVEVIAVAHQKRRPGYWASR